MNLTVCGGGLVRCCSPLLLNEGNDALEVVHPCLKLPIGHSSFGLLSTFKIVASFRIGDLGIKTSLVCTFYWGNAPSKG
jgi:hypothetical protein